MRKAKYIVPAFASSVQRGMDLRDYFAATALKTLVPLRYDEPPDKISRRAYELADAMMTQREAPKADKPLR